MLSGPDALLGVSERKGWGSPYGTELGRVGGVPVLRGVVLGLHTHRHWPLLLLRSSAKRPQHLHSSIRK